MKKSKRRRNIQLKSRLGFSAAIRVGIGPLWVAASLDPPAPTQDLAGEQLECLSRPLIFSIGLSCLFLTSAPICTGQVHEHRGASYWFREMLYAEWDYPSWAKKPEQERARLIKEQRRLAQGAVTGILREALSDQKRKANVTACLNAIQEHRVFDCVSELKRFVFKKSANDPAVTYVDTEVLKMMAFLGATDSEVCRYCKETAVQSLRMEALEQRSQLYIGDLWYAIDKLAEILWSVGGEVELRELQDKAKKAHEEWEKELEKKWDARVGRAITEDERADDDKADRRAQINSTLASAAESYLSDFAFRKQILDADEESRLALLARCLVKASECRCYEWNGVQMIRFSTRESGSRAMRKALAVYLANPRYSEDTQAIRDTISGTQLEVYEWLETYGDGLTPEEEKNESKLWQELKKPPRRVR